MASARPRDLTFERARAKKLGWRGPYDTLALYTMAPDTRTPFVDAAPSYALASRVVAAPSLRRCSRRVEGLGLGDGGGAEGNGDGGSRGGAGGCGGAGGAGSAGGDGAEPMMLFAVSTEPWGGWPWWSHWRERSSRSLGQ